VSSESFLSSVSDHSHCDNRFDSSSSVTVELMIATNGEPEMAIKTHSGGSLHLEGCDHEPAGPSENLNYVDGVRVVYTPFYTVALRIASSQHWLLMNTANDSRVLLWELAMKYEYKQEWLWKQVTPFVVRKYTYVYQKSTLCAHLCAYAYISTLCNIKSVPVYVKRFYVVSSAYSLVHLCGLITSPCCWLMVNSRCARLGCMRVSLVEVHHSNRH